MMEFDVKNMTCNHCIASITKAITALEPTADVQANLDTHRVVVKGASDQNAILSALDAAGFTAHPV